MVKRIILIITAMLAVMVAMTGIAAASTIVAGTVYDGISTTPYEGALVTAYSDSSRSTPIGTNITNNLGEYEIIDSGAITQVWVKATAPGKADAFANGVPSGNTQTKFYLIDLTFIPEFPTVALPVGAVIGLVFLFQQRKNKKE